MSFQPLLEASWVIQAHAYSAMAAFLLGLFQFAAPKGTLPHKTIGFVWIVLMSAITVSSIFIVPSIAPGTPFLQWFGPIHVFTLITGYGVVQGTYFLLRGGKGLKRHKGPFLGIYIGGIIIAGGFAFLPGRIMHEVVFGG
ncbi:MAG: hypothetical protein AAGD92_00995 [Pseudomonadota bacterium]